MLPALFFDQGNLARQVMKRDMSVLLGSVFISIVLFAVSLFISLQLSAWGKFNSQPADRRPDIQVAQESKRRLAVVFHVVVLPLASILVGLFAGRYAARPQLIALFGILPLRCYYLFLEGMHAIPISSALFGLAIAMVTARVSEKPSNAAT
jgi:nitric oxide reductase large subunit